MHQLHDDTSFYPQLPVETAELVEHLVGGTQHGLGADAEHAATCPHVAPNAVLSSAHDSCYLSDPVLTLKHTRSCSFTRSLDTLDWIRTLPRPEVSARPRLVPADFLVSGRSREIRRDVQASQTGHSRYACGHPLTVLNELRGVPWHCQSTGCDILPFRCKELRVRFVRVVRNGEFFAN